MTAVSVAVVGAGAIGSHLLGFLARHPAIQEITIVDKDVYEDKNLASQDIRPHDSGKPKAAAQARRLRQLRPGIRTSAIVDDIKNVPLGRLRSNVIFSCVDSRLARLYINQYAFRLGLPWIDSGVKSDELLARVHVYVPGASAPCLECAWDRRDYASLEQAFPCGHPSRPAATNALAALGALAASLQALEFQKLLDGHVDRVASGKQVLIDAMFQRQRVTEFKRNPGCRFDHHTWKTVRIDSAADELTLGQAIEMGRRPSSKTESMSFGVEGQRFAKRLTCPWCGLDTDLLAIESTARARRCSGCDVPLSVSGFELRDQLETAELPKKVHALTLQEIVLRPGDIYTVGDSCEQSHFELPCDEESECA